MSWLLNIANHQINEGNLKELRTGLPEWAREVLDFVELYLSKPASITQKSSGSTGKPKEIELSFSQIQQSALRSLEYFSLKESSKALLCLPPAYIGGKMMIIRALEAGLHLHCIKASADADKFPEIDLDFAAMTPMQIASIVSTKPLLVKRYKKIILGGAAVSKALEDSLASFDSEIYETYGMTETASHVALRKLGTQNFQGLKGLGFSTDSQERLIIQDQILGIKKLQTNDVVKLESANSFKWLGRADWVVNSGSLKFHPEHIERKLSGVIEEDFFVAGMPDERLGEKLCLIYASNDVLSNDKKELIATRLGKYEIPKTYLRVDDMMYNAAGKLDRKNSLKYALEL